MILVPSRTRITVFRSRVARPSLIHPPGGLSFTESARQHAIPMVVPNIARRTAAEAIVQSSRRKYDGGEFRGTAL